MSQPPNVMVPPPPRKFHWKAPTIAVLALAAAGGSGYYNWKQRGEVVGLREQRARLEGASGTLAASADQQRQAAGEAEEKLAGCREELATEKSGHADTGGRLAAAEGELGKCRSTAKDLASAQAETEEQLKEIKGLTAKFQKMIDAGDLEVTYRRGKMVVKLPDAILFPSGSADLSDRGTVAIAQVAAILKSMPERRFTIAGHTDALPISGSKFASNWELSAARAVTVTETLVRMGIAPGHLTAAAYGQYDPVASNDSKTGRQRNRRIEIILEPDLRPVPTATASVK